MRKVYYAENGDKAASVTVYECGQAEEKIWRGGVLQSCERFPVWQIDPPRPSLPQEREASREAYVNCSVR